MAAKRLRVVCEHICMLAVCFFLLWNIPYMTEAQWTFSLREYFAPVWLGLAAAALVMTRMKPGAGAYLLALPVWMGIASAYRGAEVLQAQAPQILRAVLAFGVILPAARVVRWKLLTGYVKAVLGLWTACMTLQAAIGLWAALTGHALFSLRGTWYIGVNLGDHRLYLNAYVTTGAVKLGLSALLAALGAVAFRRRALKVACVLGCLVQLACLSLTDCRTAFIAVGAGLGAMAAAAILRAGGRPGLRRALALAAALLCVLAAYACLSGLLTALSPCVPQELDNLTLTELPSHLLPHAAAEGAVQHRALEAGNLFNDRQIIWRAALRLLRREPRFLLTGTTTVLAGELTNSFILPGEYAGQPFAHVHNIYLQTLVSWGLPGALLLGAFLVRFLCAAWRVMLRYDVPMWQRLVPVPVLYVMLCEKVDCFTRLSEESPMLLFACLFAGMTLQLDARERRREAARKPAPVSVDVIIPVYNAAAYVRRAAASALACPGAGVILVDDGSTDGSGGICDALAGDPRVRVLHQANRGASAARNAGLEASGAECVAFLDADDLLVPGALSALLAQMGEADAIQGRIVRRMPDMPVCRAVRRMSGREALAEALCDPTRRLLCHGWVFRRELLKERFHEALTMGEDGEWLLRTLPHARSAAFADLPVYRYTVRPDSALHGGSGVTEAYLRTLEAARPALERLGLPREAALYRLTHLLLILTHGGDGQAEQLRDGEPFMQDFTCARLRGASPRMTALRLLRRRAFAAARGCIRVRRWMNRLSEERLPETDPDWHISETQLD